jgi:hypothetical protein
MRGRGLAGIVVVVLVGILAAPASADPTLVGRTSSAGISGPRLAGPSLFYAENGSKRIVLRLAAPGADPRKLLSLSPPPSPPDEDEESPGDFVSYSFEIAGSANRLGYKSVVFSGNARYQVGQSHLDFYEGPPAGDLARTINCGHSDIYSPAAAALDIDGPRVAATDCTGRVVVRDHSTPTPTETIVSAGDGLAIGTVKIAGRYLAYNAYPIGPTGSSPTVTVVHDWLANKKVYEVPRVSSFEIQDDATLAVSTGQVDDLDCSDGKLAWYSAAQPTEHVLPVKPCTSDVQIAKNRISAVATGEEDTERMLVLVGLDGTRTDAVRLGTSLRRGGIDYDGERVAYALGNCFGGADLMTESATSPALETERADCPVRGLPSKVLIGPKESGAFVNLDCPLGCRGRMAITAKINGKTRRIGKRSVNVGPENSCGALMHRVSIASSARSILRRRGSLLARVTVTTSDRSGAPRITTRAFRLRVKEGLGRPRDCTA